MFLQFWSCVFCFYWATVCKTVRPMLSDRCLSVLSVCDVGVLWPKGWMDQDETWHGGRSRPWPHCVRWGLRSLPQSGHSLPQFLAHVCHGQTAVWIKLSLAREVGLGPGDIVRWGPSSPLHKGGTAPPPLFGPCLLWPNGCPSQLLLSTCCVRFSFYSTMPRDWLGRMSLKWLVLCRVRRKILMSRPANSSKALNWTLTCTVSRMCVCVCRWMIWYVTSCRRPTVWCLTGVKSLLAAV